MAHLSPLRALRRTPSMLTRVRAAASVERSVLFFAEDSSDWLHIGPLANHLEEIGYLVLRLTADPKDPVISNHDGLFVGRTVAAATLFLRLPPCVLVTTMTDLDTYHLKRSVNDVHYVYVFHSLLSTHRAYRQNAFTAYDSIFCASPNHLIELQTVANLRPSRAQMLYSTGYCRLDTLLAETKDTVNVNRDLPRVLIAPTWGPSSLLEFDLDKIIHGLLTHNIEVVLRFHPMSVRHNASLTHEYQSRFGNNPNFSLDNSFESSKSLIESDIVLSDWSGAAHEFSLAFLRPTVFIDTPPKAHNDVYHLLGLDCYEDAVRENLGALIALDQIETVPNVVTTLFNDRIKWQQRLLSLRNSIVFNPGNAIATAATQLQDIISQHSTR